MYICFSETLINKKFLDQPDEDELTQDYPEQLLKPLKTTNKPPKKKAEQRERDDGNPEPIAVSI